MSGRSRGRSRSRPGTPARRRLLALGLVLSAAVLAGSLFDAARHAELSLDLSVGRLPPPSRSTIRAVEALDRDVEALLFFAPGDPVHARLRPWLDELAARTERLSVRRVDPLAEPDLARRHEVTDEGVLVLASAAGPSGRMDVGRSLTDARPTLRRLDARFLEALAAAATPPAPVYVVQGHGEPPLRGEGAPTTLWDLLRRSHLPVRTLDAQRGLTRAVPADAAMVLLLDPRSPLLEAETAALARHVRGGGRLWVALEPGGASLEGLLGELGARPSSGPVHTATGGDRPLVRASRGHPVTAAIDAPFALNGALAFERIRAPSMRAVAPLRVDEGWIDDGDGELGEGEAVEPRPVLVAVRAMARRSQTRERPREGRAVLLGDASPLFRLDEGGPRALVRSTLEWLGDRPGARTPTIATRPEELERHHGRGDARPVYLAVALGPPLLLFGVAWSRRRRP